MMKCLNHKFALRTDVPDKEEDNIHDTQHFNSSSGEDIDDDPMMSMKSHGIAWKLWISVKVVWVLAFFGTIEGKRKLL